MKPLFVGRLLVALFLVALFLLESRSAFADEIDRPAPQRSESRAHALVAGADVELGKTNSGHLGTGDFALFATIEGVVGRFRLGAGPQLSYFWMSRADTSTGPHVDAFGLGIRTRVSFDLVRFDEGKGRAIFLAVSSDLEWLRGWSYFLSVNGGTAALRANGTLGVRF